MGSSIGFCPARLNADCSNPKIGTLRAKPVSPIATKTTPTGNRFAGLASPEDDEDDEPEVEVAQAKEGQECPAVEESKPKRSTKAVRRRKRTAKKSRTESDEMELWVESTAEEAPTQEEKKAERTPEQAANEAPASGEEKAESAPPRKKEDQAAQEAASEAAEDEEDMTCIDCETLQPVSFDLSALSASMSVAKSRMTDQSNAIHLQSNASASMRVAKSGSADQSNAIHLQSNASASMRVAKPDVDQSNAIHVPPVP